MCCHPWNLTAGTPSHEGLVDRYDFHVGLAFQGKFPGPPSQEEWTGRWSRNSSEWSAIPHVARDLQTRNAARMDYGSADGAFWNLARVRWVLVVSAPVVVVVFPYLFGKVLGMITMKDGVTHEVQYLSQFGAASTMLPRIPYIPSCFQVRTSSLSFSYIRFVRHGIKTVYFCHIWSIPCALHFRFTSPKELNALMLQIELQYI